MSGASEQAQRLLTEEFDPEFLRVAGKLPEPHKVSPAAMLYDIKNRALRGYQSGGPDPQLLSPAHFLAMQSIRQQWPRLMANLPQWWHEYQQTGKSPSAAGMPRMRDIGLGRFAENLGDIQSRVGEGWEGGDIGDIVRDINMSAASPSYLGPGASQGKSISPMGLPHGKQYHMLEQLGLDQGPFTFDTRHQSLLDRPAHLYSNVPISHTPVKRETLRGWQERGGRPAGTHARVVAPRSRESLLSHFEEHEPEMAQFAYEHTGPQALLQTPMAQEIAGLTPPDMGESPSRLAATMWHRPTGFKGQPDMPPERALLDYFVSQASDPQALAEAMVSGMQEGGQGWLGKSDVRKAPLDPQTLGMLALSGGMAAIPPAAWALNRLIHGSHTQQSKRHRERQMLDSGEWEEDPNPRMPLRRTPLGRAMDEIREQRKQEEIEAADRRQQEHRAREEGEWGGMSQWDYLRQQEPEVPFSRSTTFDPVLAEPRTTVSAAPVAVLPPTERASLSEQWGPEAQYGAGSVGVLPQMGREEAMDILSRTLPQE